MHKLGAARSCAHLEQAVLKHQHVFRHAPAPQLVKRNV
jgi:hypothetical protein